MSPSSLSRRVVRVGSLLAVALASLAGSCTAPRRTATAQCAFNSDCADGLFCISSQCRPQCQMDTDCPMGQRCARELANEALMGNPHPVCVDHEDYYCNYDSDCQVVNAHDRCLPSGECGHECLEDYDCRDSLHGHYCNMIESSECVQCLPTNDRCAIDFGTGMHCDGASHTPPTCVGPADAGAPDSAPPVEASVPDSAAPEGGAVDASTPDAVPPGD